MTKVEVIKEFTLKDFNKIKNLERGTTKNQDGFLYPTDTFECTKDMVEYLTGKNALGITVVKILEIVPEKVEVITEPITEIKKEVSKKTTTRKKKISKK